MSIDNLSFAPFPPAGWNSFDCFGSAVTEAEVFANAEILARELLPAGYDTIVVDYCWSHPSPGACANPDQAKGSQPYLAIDADHRLLPAPSRFPSATDGAGFKPLADRVHALGLKFGLHIMRGFPLQALYPAFPTKPTGGLRVADIADPADTCSWLNHMCGVRATPAGQAYYDSLFRLYADWGVDYVKVDDIAQPYRAVEIEMVDLARRRCGRPITLSLSPGACPLDQATHVARHAELWRVSPDFWDRWEDLRRAFELCRLWAPHRAPGAWPDPDMLPVGRLSRRGPAGPERESFFTPAEQRTLLALWSLFRAPLFIGGDLRVMDRTTLDLLRDPALARIRREGLGANCVAHDEHQSIWVSASADGQTRFVGVFNLSDHDTPSPCITAALGLDASTFQITALWPEQSHLAAHDVALWSLSPARAPAPA